MRHGEAKPQNEDPRRPLSQRGRLEVEEVSRLAMVKRVRVHQILHSGKLRARETAEIMARCLQPPQGICEIRGLDPLEDPMIAKGELEAAQAPVMLVGHLPHLARLASLLLTGGPEQEEIVGLSPATMACLRWEESWKLAWTLRPDGSLVSQ